MSLKVEALWRLTAAAPNHRADDPKVLAMNCTLGRTHQLESHNGPVIARPRSHSALLDVLTIGWTMGAGLPTEPAARRESWIVNSANWVITNQLSC